MADAADSKSAGGNFVWVQVPLPAEGNPFGFPFFIDFFYLSTKVPTLERST